ncbi:unnamed protein product [Ceratitis capitata]|uniref:(Mediterranean fruit fly) hypothetical protein n=1 Tax=Ceratitis capitata TaxID=7213 RepID=A0A811U532_CERCA|nr:unnamed protein product [Ceratitis capitata]
MLWHCKNYEWPGTTATTFQQMPTLARWGTLEWLLSWTRLLTKLTRWQGTTNNSHQNDNCILERIAGQLRSITYKKSKRDQTKQILNNSELLLALEVQSSKRPTPHDP